MARRERGERKKIKWSSLVKSLCALLVVFALAFPIYHFTGPEYSTETLIMVDDGWTVTAKDEVFEDISMGSTLFGMQNRGDVLTMTHQMTEDLYIPNAVLECYSVHSVVDAYVDDVLVYSYGHEMYEKNQLLGYGYNYIKLPDNYVGKQLTIQFLVTEDNAFEGLPAMKLRDGTNMIQAEASHNRINLAIILFLIMFGILGTLVSVFMMYRDRAFFKVFCVSAFSICVGAWTLCNSDLISLFATDLRVKVYMEYISFFLIIPPFLAYFRDTIVSEDTPKWMRYYYHIVCGINVVQVVTIFVCHTTNIAHFPRFVTSEHVMIVLALVLALFVAYVEIKKKKAISSIAVGFSIAFLAAFLEVIRFNLAKYLVGFSGNHYESTIEFAALIIVVTLFVDFCQQIRLDLVQVAQQELLQRLAYMDELTELANRRKCDEVMDQLTTDYVIVSLDMNGLKQINDNYGHEVGDRALVAFAKILGKAFPNSATVGRMGGDEFIAILPETEELKVMKYVDDMCHQVEQFNDTSGEPFVLGGAWGIASGLAKDNPHEVYSIADSKMYERKRQMKAL